MFKLKPFLLVLILFIPLLACRASTPSTLVPASSEAPSAEAALPTQTGYVAPPSVPTDTPITQADPLKVLQAWFYQDKTDATSLYFAFLVQNPNPAMTVVNTHYQVVAYDAANTILGNADASVGVIFPTETQVVTSPLAMRVPENTVVSRVELNLVTPGNPDASLNVTVVPSGGGQGSTYSGGPFQVSNVKYFPNSSGGPQASGTVQNLVGNIDYRYVYVTAVAFDTDGKIAGVGLNPTQIDIRAHGTVGVVTDAIQLTGNPVRVELFPVISENIGAARDASQPDPVQVIRSGATQDGTISAQYGLVIKNTDPLNDRVNINYLATGLDADGAVIGIDSRFIPVIFPGEQTGASGDMTLIENTKLARIEVQIESDGDPNDSNNYQKAGLTTNPLTAQQCNLISSTTGTCMLKNSSSYDLGTTTATIIAYDETGTVIGGGDDMIDGVPANGQAAIEVDSLPAQTNKIEAYARPDSPLELTATQTQPAGADTPTPAINTPTP